MASAAVARSMMARNMGRCPQRSKTALLHEVCHIQLGRPVACHLLDPGRERLLMVRIARKHSHFVFGGLQAGLTSLIAAGVASFPLPTIGQFLSHWMSSWLIAWAVMLPVVMLAAPLIRAASIALTRE